MMANAPCSFLPNMELMNVLVSAYSPCKNFGVCKQARFDPSSGHVPRGFLGATGDLKAVKVIFLFAEPGHPHIDERYRDITGTELLTASLHQVYNCFKTSKDRFHSNTRWVLDQLFPKVSFDDQLKHVWLTEGRLCSIDNEIGRFNDTECGKMFLAKQLNLLPNATVIAFGKKAQHRLSVIRNEVRQTVINAVALSPPGANHKGAKPSWETAISKVRELKNL